MAQAVRANFKINMQISLFPSYPELRSRIVTIATKKPSVTVGIK